MTWSVFYLCCLGAGTLLCAVAVLTGGHGAGHGVPHLHLRVHTGSAHAASGMSWLNVFTLTAFLCWFGGMGYLLERDPAIVRWVALVGAVVSGVFGASLLQWFLTRVLLPRERALTAEETSIPGVVGRVSGSLHGNSVGEVIYPQMGARRSVPARSADGQPIGRDQEVIVLRYEKGIAYVQPWHELEVEGIDPATSERNDASGTEVSFGR